MCKNSELGNDFFGCGQRLGAAVPSVAVVVLAVVLLSRGGRYRALAEKQCEEGEE